MPDDAKHVWASFGISVLTTELVNQQIDREGLSLLVGTSTSLLITIGGKEIIHDKLMNRGVYSIDDIASDAWGVLLSAPVMVVKWDITKNGLVRRKPNKKHKKRKHEKNFISVGDYSHSDAFKFN